MSGLLDPLAGEPASSTRQTEASRGPLRLMRVLFLVAGFSPDGVAQIGALFFLSRGMDVSQIGVLGAVIFLVQAPANLFWGSVADKLRRRKAVTLVAHSIAVGALLVLSLPWVSCDGCFWRMLAACAALASSSSTLYGACSAFVLDFLGPARKDDYGQVAASPQRVYAVVLQ